MAKSKTSSAVKNRYNLKSYDRLAITVPKGRKEDLEARAQVTGAGSINRYINNLVCEDLGLTQTEWGYKEKGVQHDD